MSDFFSQKNHNLYAIPSTTVNWPIEMEQDGASFGQNEDEVFVGLLREWWRLASQEMERALGLEEATRVFLPYCRNAGYSGSLNMREASGLKTDTLERLAVFNFNIVESYAGGSGRVWIDGDSAFGERYGCVHQGCSRFQCVTTCELMAGFLTTTLNPEYEIDLASSLSQGHPCCRWNYRRRGEEFLTRSPKELTAPLLPSEVINFLGNAIAGEIWDNITRSLVDAIGRESAMNFLLPSMRESGRTFAISHLAQLNPNDGPGLQTSMDTINRILHRQGHSTWNGDRGEGTVTECPFSGAPVEICEQFEAFCNGLCSALAPGSRFFYDRKMTGGGDSCHWIVDGSTAPLEEDAQVEEEGPRETALELLKKRLVLGEITPEQYRELRDILLEK